RDVRVEQDRNAVERRTPALLRARRPKVPVLERLIGIRLVNGLADPSDRFDGGRRMRVVEQRRRSGEALVPHQLFRINAAVRLAEDSMTLTGDLTQGVVDRHCERFGYGGNCLVGSDYTSSPPASAFSQAVHRLPRSACSCSIASKSALKFPFPKLFAPFRSMISYD